jgi:hypothetical protein
VTPRRLGGGRSRIAPAGITAPPISTAGPALSTAALDAARETGCLGPPWDTLTE